MRSIAKMLATGIIGAALAAVPLVAQTATIDYDHTVNFAKFKTYTWGKIHATDPSVEDRITIAANRDLSQEYMTEVDSGSDVTITAVEATQDKAEFGSFYDGLSGYTWQRGWGAGGFLDNAATVQDIPVDTLVLDMYDTKTHKLLWRGTVTQPVGGNQDKNDQKIDKAVTQLIGKYPPKFKK
ncbi:MAG: DUF4136 domain-containing protein [Acidobacteriaceae bacterium]|jgi:hypothetical protein